MANTLATQMDNIFTMIRGAQYERGVTKEIAINGMMNILTVGDQTVSVWQNSTITTTPFGMEITRVRIKFCLSIFILLIITALIAIPAYADEAGSSINIREFASSSGLPSAVLIHALEQPLSINKELNSVLIPDHAWEFLKDLNLKLYTLTTSDGTQSLGLSYTLAKDLKRFFFTKSNSLQTGISYSLNLDGNIAVIQNANPNDFLISDFSIHYFRSQGEAIQADEALYTSLNQLEDKMASLGDLNQLLASSEYKDFSKALQKNMTNQYYIDFPAISGYESNYSCKEKQLYYGVKLGLDLKAWNPQFKLAQYNIFDWPFALIRFYPVMTMFSLPAALPYPLSYWDWTWWILKAGSSKNSIRMIPFIRASGRRIPFGLLFPYRIYFFRGLLPLLLAASCV